MNRSSSTGVALIGFGNVAQRHLAALAADRRVSRIMIYDVDPDVCVRAKTLYPQARICKSLHETLGMPGLSAVFICSPPSQHAGAILAAIERRVPIFVEKPISLDLQEARDLTRAVDDVGIVNASGYQSRYGGLIPFLRSCFDGVHIVMAVANRFSRPTVPAWYRTHPGGQITDVVTHQIDLLRALVGEVQSVSGLSYHSAGDRSNCHAISAHVGTMSFRNGAVATLTANTTSPYGNPRHLRGVSLFGVGMTASVLGHEGEPRTVEIIERSGRWRRRFRADVMGIQARTFLDASLTGDQALIRSSMHNGLENLEVTDAMRRSIFGGGQRIELRAESQDE